MVKIDGDKVKQLRERQGLTQLYVATVVQVTTDTISRWENKRYPTIKKENGLRLAEALEVELADILIIEEASDDSEEQQLGEVSSPVPAADSGPRFRPFWRYIVLGCLVASMATAALAYYLLIVKQPAPTIQAQRFLPSQCTVGQPFPVAIKVMTGQAEPLTLIVREALPANVTIQASAPPLPGTTPKDNALKWLKKVEGTALFTYTAILTAPTTGELKFSGTVATANDGGKTFPIAGAATLTPSLYHWADSDGDNRISDLEILTIYDQYGDLAKLGIDVDLIEGIWLGSGYRWNEKKKVYEILP